MLARALYLPSKRWNLDAASTGPLVVSEEEAVFMEELVSSWLVLQDNGRELPAEVLKVKFLIKEKRLEEVDWAELIWFMVRRELLKGAKLVNCHYASHMQLLLMNQKPGLFVNRVEIFEGWEKQRVLGVGDSAVAVKESKSERKTESQSTQERFSKWRNSSSEQSEEGSPCGGNGKLKLKLLGSGGDGEDDEIKWIVTEELFVGNSGELPDSLEKKLTVDFECNEKNEWQWELVDLEFGYSNDMLLMNGHCNDERLKTEGSGMHEQMDIDSGHENGEKEFALDGLVENCKNISEKLCTLDELHVVKMESENKELKLLTDGADERKLPNELASAELHHEDARELSEFDRKNGDFIGRQEKEANNNDSEGAKQMDSANNMLANEESREERLKVDGSTNLSMSEIPHHDGMQETNFHQMDLVVFSDDKGEISTSNDHHAIDIETTDENMKMIKCDLAEYQNAIDGETFTSGDRHAVETEDENRKVLQNELPEGSMEDEQINSKAGEFLESQEKKGDYNSKERQTKMMRDGDFQKEFSRAVKEVVLFHDNQEVEICFTAEKEKPEQLCTAKPEASGLNEISLKSSSFTVVQQEIRFTDLKREEINCWNVTNSAAAATADDEESYDLDLCSNQVQLWMSRLKNAVKNQMKNGKENEMLVKELETKNKMLQDSEKRRCEEQQRYQKNIGRLEREVFLMKNILEEYRKALYEVDKSFAEYRRKRTQQEEEHPVYVDHPDGGGNVVLATELVEEFKNFKQSLRYN